MTVIQSIINLSTEIFSSNELKAQVSFLDLLFVVRLSVNFSHLYLILRNHWANFYKTCHKAPLGKGDSSLFNDELRLIRRGANDEI